jgi:hypothetical protein
MPSLKQYMSQVLAVYSLLLPMAAITAIADTGCLAAQYNMDWQLDAEHSQYRSNAMFTDTKTKNEKIDAVLNMQLKYCGWQANAAYHHSRPLTSTSQATHLTPKLVLKELVWQTSLDNELPLDVTFGKTQLDWSIGYAHQPLDIFRPYQGQSLGLDTEQGTGILAVSYFDAVGEWTLALSAPAWASDKDATAIQSANQPTLGLRHYRLVGDAEIVAQVAYDQGRGMIVGGGWTRGMGDALQLHASALWQQNYQAYVIPNALLAPVTAQQHNAGQQLLAGFTWADAIGQTFIAEYSYDPRAWSDTQWHKAFNRLDTLSGMPGTQALRQSYGLGYKHKNTMRHNLMLHWSLAATAWSNWSWSAGQTWLRQMTPSVDLAYAPQDGGYIATPQLTWQWDQSAEQSLEIDLSVRYFGGPSRSSYANLQLQRQTLVSLKGHL